MSRYLLGVDGGNAKTDYLLFTEDGDYVDYLSAKTVSHEAELGFDGMEYAMTRQLMRLCKKNGIQLDDIAAAGMGLAGADLPWQMEELKKRVRKIGIRLFDLNNDAVLGIKAALPQGVGLSAVNGAGTAVVGFDELGKTLQIGGMGPISGDYAGGTYIFTRIMSGLYDYHYRFGGISSMYPKILKAYSIEPSGLSELIGNSERLYGLTPEVIQIANESAKKGDKIAQGIFDNAGRDIGRSAAGCIKNLSFDSMGTEYNPIGIALVGAIWREVDYSGLIDVFIDTASRLSGKICGAIFPSAKPVLGGVYWAKELLDGRPPTKLFRKNAEDAMVLASLQA